MSWKNGRRFFGRTTVQFLALAGLCALAASPTFAADDGDGPAPSGPSFSGNVSWYGAQFNGRKTASGEIFDMKKHTAAHRKLKFGTKVLIENPRTGKSVVVRVNDRGPYAKGRVLDLSRGAAEKLGILLGGVAYVDCTILAADAGAKSMERMIITGQETFELIPVSAS